MHTKRIIPCLDVNAGRVVKGVNFVNLVDAGDPVEIAKAYDKAGADEVVFLDITASSDNRNTVVDMVRRVAEEVFIPSKNASDIHLTAGAPTSIRINGELKKFDGMDEEVVSRTILSMLTAEQEKRLGEGEDIDFSFTAQSGGRQRVNVYHYNGGKLAAAIRLLNEDVPSFKDICLPQAAIDLTKELKGLILVTGPTGSGKTTTLYSVINQLNDNKKKIITRP